MKEHDNFFNHLKENTDRLEERPSPNAWAKLEAKLDQKKESKKVAKRVSMVQFFAIAASISLIIGVFLTINQDIEKSATPSLANNVSYSLENLEDLENDNIANNTASSQLAIYRAKLNASPSGLIEEGNYQKRLMTHQTKGKRTLLPTRKKPMDL